MAHEIPEREIPDFGSGILWPLKAVNAVGETNESRCVQ